MATQNKQPSAEQTFNILFCLVESTPGSSKMITVLKVTSVMVGLFFINSIADGQQVSDGTIRQGVHYQMYDQAFSEANPITSGVACGGEQGGRCYGTCYKSTIVQPDACDSCGSACGGTCKGCHGGCGGCLSGLHSPDGLLEKHRQYFRHKPDLLCPGERVNSLLETQIANGREAQLAFYGFHFQWNAESGVWQLTQSGWYNVQKLARILPLTSGTILVDPTGDPQIDESRAQVVRAAFAQNGISQVPVNVVVGKPRGIGISGAEALRIYDQRQLGSPYSSSSAGSGGFGFSSGVDSGTR
jgi:hypothetical protein